MLVGHGGFLSAADTPADAAGATAKINELIAQRWAAAKAQPAAPASDAEFLRRVYLDLLGRIPTVFEVRAFLDNTTPNKRQRCVEQLLARPAFSTHFARVWRAWLLPDSNILAEGLAPGFEAWLRMRLRANVGYDRLVGELLTAGAPVRQSRQQLVTDQSGQANPLAFYQLNENKPENLAGSTARLFLGLKLECAQCHDHPLGRWSREQFWQLAAFFNGPKWDMQIPGTDRTVPARFPDASAPDRLALRDPRTTLADWMTAPKNPFFARAVVNRLWAYFFGIGLVEPVDDLSDQNPASHPALLDELARQFVAHQCDLQFLIRAITASRAYQLTSANSHPSQEEARLFARKAVKGLSPEQLYDSLAQALGQSDSSGRATANRADFLARFRHTGDNPTAVQTSILQALSLMNGPLVADATRLDRSATLAAVADAPFLDTAERIEALYLATLSRPADAEERTSLVAYVAKGGPTHNPSRALADVFWALLNSSEFILNH
jgi:hypothetical protein